eukprot:scaffold4425_cov168-Amphora_coffeaeformis.AAC.5
MRWLPTTHKAGRVVLVVCLIFLAVAILLAFYLPDPSTTSNIWGATSRQELPGPCAIALYGLPRSFGSLVLPSLIQNVIQPNAVYRCDYFVYFHNILIDPGGRDDRSGNVHGEEVHLLQAAVRKHHLAPFPSVTIGNFTDDDFWETRQPLLQKIHLAKDSQGRSIFVPYNHPTYSNISIENVVKMWHAQDAVWALLESSQTKAGSIKHYSRIAMLRLDVVYLTPINIYELPNKALDYDNAVAVIPNFARHPVNDRMIYGPYEAVQVWASQRMSRLDQHGRFIAQHAPGDGIHSERFLNYTIFPVIRQRGISIQTHPDMCFLRTRADGGVRFTDCGPRHATRNNYQAVKSVLAGRDCHPNMTHMNRSIVLLECSGEGSSVVASEQITKPVSWHQGCFIDEKTPSPKQRKKHPFKPCVQPHVQGAAKHNIALDKFATLFKLGFKFLVTDGFGGNGNLPNQLFETPESADGGPFVGIRQLLYLNELGTFAPCVDSFHPVK